VAKRSILLYKLYKQSRATIILIQLYGLFPACNIYSSVLLYFLLYIPISGKPKYFRKAKNEWKAWPLDLNLNFYVSRRFCFVYEVGVRKVFRTLEQRTTTSKFKAGLLLWGSAIDETSRDNTSCGLRQVPPTQFSGYQFYGAGSKRDPILFSLSVLG
jgi:hypothetical protein